MPNNDGPVVMLLEQIKDSLGREMQNLGKEIHEFREEMTVRFDNQNARLDRQAGLIQTGQRWTARQNTWSERVDKALAKKDAQIADITKRLAKLEGRSKRAS